MKKFGIVVFLVSVVSINVFAEAKITVDIKGELPEVSRVEKGILQISYSDGREAQLSINEVKRWPFQYDAEIVENTCAKDFKRQMCKYSLAIVPEVIGFVWTKHGETEKIGSMVKDEDLDPLTTVTNLHMWDSKYVESLSPVYKTPFTKKYQDEVGDMQLSCLDFSWAKPFLDESSKFKIEEWTSESNVENEETGLNQNLMVSAYMDIESNIDLLKNELKLTSIGFSPPLRERPVLSSLLFGDVLGWSIRKKDNSMCEVALKADSQSFLGFLTTLFSNLGSFKFSPIENVTDLEIYSDDQDETISDDDLDLLKKGVSESDFNKIKELSRLKLIDVSSSKSTTDSGEVSEADFTIYVKEVN